MKSKPYILSLILLVLFIGCTSDDEGPTEPGEYTPADSTWSDGSGGWFVRLDATSYEHYRYFNLDEREVVDIGDDQAGSDNSWHIAFSRVNGKLNGGVAGPLGLKAVNLADIGHPDSASFDNVTSVPDVADSLWEEDALNLVFDPWWSYDPVQHRVFPTRNLFVMRTAGGGYAKVLVDSITDAGRPPNMGKLTLKYVYQSSGIDLSGSAQYARIDGSEGEVFFSFVRGGEVSISDRMTSTEWDIRFAADLSGYWAEINSGMHGPGEAAVYPMYLETNDFDTVVSAPQGGGYFQDVIRSVFGAPTVPGSEWYDYNPVVHEIISKGHIYILKLPSDSCFKLEIVNYYHVIEGQPQGGWMTIHFQEL